MYRTVSLLGSFSVIHLRVLPASSGGKQLFFSRLSRAFSGLTTVCLRYSWGFLMVSMGRVLEGRVSSLERFLRDGYFYSDFIAGLLFSRILPI